MTVMMSDSTAAEELSSVFDPVEGDLDEINEARRLLKGRMAPVLAVLGQPGVSELMVNRPEDWWIEDRDGMHPIRPPVDPKVVGSIIVLLGKLAGKDLGRRAKGLCVNVRAGTKLRIAAALYPVSMEGHSLCIRRHLPCDADLRDFQQQAPADASPPAGGMAHLPWDQWLARQVKDRANVLVSGATGSGKTTFTNALLAHAPQEDRIICIEDTPELKIRGPNRVRFETHGDDDARALLRLTLRYRPDRIVVGEVRGEEAYDLLQAWNTGHPGGVSTVHANSSEEAMYRLESLVTQSEQVKTWPLSAVRRACASAVDVVVHLAKRRVVEIVRVEGLAPGGGYAIRRVFPRGVAQSTGGLRDEASVREVQ